MNCQSNADNLFISYKFASSQEHFDECVRVTLTQWITATIPPSRPSIIQHRIFICASISLSQPYSWAELVVLASRSSNVEASWNVMARAQKPDSVFRRNGRGHLNRRGPHFSRLLAAEVCASAVVILDTPSSEMVRTVLATHSIRQFPLHFPSRASPCAITF